MKSSDPSNSTKPSSEFFEPIAIIGMSCMFPKAQSLPEYWANINGKVDAITDIPPTHWQLEDYFSSDQKKPDHTYCKRGGFLSPIKYDPSEFGISPAALEAIDTSQLFGLVVAQGAMIDAGYGPGKKFNRDRIGVVLGLTGTLELVIPLGARLGHPIWRRELKKAGINDDIAEEVIRNIGDAYVSWQENSFPGLLGNVTAGRIANRLDLGGTNCVVDAACASSLSAVHIASMELDSGKADMMITGGVDTFNDIFMYMCFSKTPALSPTHDVRPFSVDSDGTILGEGLGMVVLKKLSKAQADGDKIYAVIKGIGTSSDGKGKAIYAPDSKGQAKALRRAYEIAGLEPETVGLIEAHGTGTKVGDVIEVTALKEVFGKAEDEFPQIGIGSVKSMIGHTKAAAGSAGLIKVAMALKNKVLPPTIKISKPSAAFEEKDCPFYLLTEKRPWFSNDDFPRRSGASSFGFGGSNFHVVLEEYSKEKSNPDWDWDIELFTFSADNLKDLKNKLEDLRKCTSKLEAKRFAESSRISFSSSQSRKLTFSIDFRKSSITQYLDQMFKSFETLGDANFALPEGIFYTNGTGKKKTALLFPGQGAQYLDMGRDLACLLPQTFETFQEANRILRDCFGKKRLTDLIFPPTTFDEARKKSYEEELTLTQTAQPAIGAYQIGVYHALKHFGLIPDVAAGHSYGELSALCAAGVFGFPEFIKISRIRGELMSEMSGERGGMLAVSADSGEVEKLIKEWGIELTPANYNSPKQIVLSGKIDAVNAAFDKFNTKAIKSTVLQVSGAFHSKLVSKAVKPFSKKLEKFQLEAPKLPVYSNFTGEPYPSDPDEIKTLLTKQIANPVNFVKIIEEIYSSGIETFIEIGPGSRLSGLVKSILGNRSFHILTLDSSSGRKNGTYDLARFLAQSASLGIKLDLSKWNEGVLPEALPSDGKKKLAFEISGANYRSPRPQSRQQSLPLRTQTLGQPSNQASVNVKSTATSDTGSTSVSANSRSSNATYGLGSSPTSALSTNSISRSLTNAESSGKLPESSNAVFSARPVTSSPATEHSDSNGTFSLASAQQSGTTFSGNFPQKSDSHSTTPSSYMTGAPRQIQDDSRSNFAREALNALQNLQQQTADLHKKFLESQESAQNALQGLIEQHYEILAGTSSRRTIDFQQSQKHTLPQGNSQTQFEAYSKIRPESRFEPETKHPIKPKVKPEIESETRSSTKAEITSKVQIKSDSYFQTTSAKHSGISIDATLLGVVTEKTGYPLEMLNLDMDMEADLGIDSIKRVEIMSAVQEKVPELPPIQPDQLGRFKTLRQIIDFAGKIVTQVDTSKTDTFHPAFAVAKHDTERPSKNIQHLDDSFSKQAHPNKNDPGNLPSENATEVLLAVVCEKTGYPREMLNLDMDMEADLGIDSIKRVEIMSAVQEKIPQLPPVQPDQLGRFKTLRQIIDLVSSMAPGNKDFEDKVSTRGKPQLAMEENALTSPSTGSEFTSILLGIVCEKTGYPQDMLNLDMDMEADLGIDSIKRVEIMSAVQEKMPHAPVIQPDQLGKLKTLSQIINYLGTSANSKGSSSNSGKPSQENGFSGNKSTHVSDETIASSDSTSSRDSSLPNANVSGKTGLPGNYYVPERTAHLAVATKSSPQEQDSVNFPAQKKSSETEIKATAREIKNHLLSAVSEKTGYPVEMLNLDMDMEADLGIDSIKRVEILSAFQERLPDLPAIQPGDLGKLKTLNQIIEALLSATNLPKQLPKSSEPPKLSQVNTVKVKRPLSGLKRLLVKPTPLSDSERPQIALKPASNILITNDGTNLSLELLKVFTKKGFKARLIGYDEIEWQGITDVSGLIIVSPSKIPQGKLPWNEDNEQFVKDSFNLLKGFSKSLINQAELGGSFFGVIERLDGSFGFSREGPQGIPVFGALSGLAKTAAREWPKVNVKVLDVAPDITKVPDISELIYQEMVQTGPIEIGIKDGKKIFLREEVTQLELQEKATPTWNPDDLILVSGGAKGVTPSVAIEIAREYGCRMVLLGRTELLEEPDWLRHYQHEEEMKSVIYANATSGKMTPRELESKYSFYKSNREINRTLKEIRNVGGKSYYYSVDIRNREKLQTVIAEITKAHGSITGFVHGAGVLRDKKIVEKTLDQFEDVFQTKIGGLRNILENLKIPSLKGIVFFSSISGRFGRIGQSDYSMANEALNKIAQYLSRNNPGCRVLSVNWGPWAGGMVNDSLRKVFNTEGVGLISLDEGSSYLVQELNSPSKEIEVVVLTADSKIEEKFVDIVPDQIVQENKTSLNQVQAKKIAEPKMYVGVRRALALDKDFYLSSHVINGEPVFPTAMMIELIAQGALHENPGLVFHGVNDLRILKGIILSKNHPYNVSVLTSKVKGSEKFPEVICELKGESLKNEILHCKASVILGEKFPIPEKPVLSPDLKWVYPKSIEMSYSKILFHGKQFMGIKKIKGWSSEGIAGNVLTAPPTDQWMKEPFRSSWIADPLALDCAFQMLILWTVQEFGMASLPCYIGSYRQYRAAFPPSGVKVVAKAHKSGLNTVRANIEFIDDSGTLVASIMDYECVMNSSLINVFREGSVEKAHGNS
ncbi:MAG: SDR family NAD(P)-dependent oxidoreductase [Candidatus Riflebacteria bacterium]|nr:SDR family NAD(P)-dependent oxidoreductase [Candidatus Riflebacteria bacterium]